MLPALGFFAIPAVKQSPNIYMIACYFRQRAVRNNQHRAQMGLIHNSCDNFFTPGWIPHAAHLQMQTWDISLVNGCVAS